MVRNIITAIFFVIMAIIMIANFMGCSDISENPVPWPGDLEVEEPKYDLDNNEAFEGIFECGVKGLSNPEKELMIATNKLLEKLI